MADFNHAPEVQEVFGGLITQSGTTTVNAGQVVSYAHQPNRFYWSTQMNIGMLAGISDTVNGSSTTRLVRAIIAPNGEIGIKTSPGSPLTMSAPAQVDVGNASETLVAANTSRRYLVLANTDTSATVYLAFGATAESGKGIPLFPLGIFEMSEAAGNLNLGAINAISTDASAIVAVQEGT